MQRYVYCMYAEDKATISRYKRVIKDRHHHGDRRVSTLETKVSLWRSAGEGSFLSPGQLTYSLILSATKGTGKSKTAFLELLREGTWEWQCRRSQIRYLLARLCWRTLAHYFTSADDPSLNEQKKKNEALTFCFSTEQCTDRINRTYQHLVMLLVL